MAATQLDKGGKMSGIRELLPGIFVIDDICNVYLIRAADAAIAIDFGTGRALSFLDRVKAKRLDWILHTHFHRDCCQGDCLAIERGAKIAVPAAERKYFDQAEEFWKKTTLFSYHGVYSDRNCSTWNIHVNHDLNHGDVFRWRGIDIRAVETPGHTRGSLSYVVELTGKRIAFSGDLIFAPGKTMTYHDMHWNYLTPILSTAADGTVTEMGMDQGFKRQIESCDRLLRENLDLILPAHGEPISEPASALTQLKDRVSDVYEAVLRKTVHTREPVPRWISPHLIYLGNTSFGILGDSGKVFLVDYSYGNEDMIEKGRKEFGFGGIEVAYPTHFHPDHGGFKELLDKEPFEVWADSHVVGPLENPKRYKLPGLNPDPVKVNRVLGEMEEFDWGGHHFTSFHFPCHTHYASGLLVELDGKRVLFCGDNVNLVQGRKLQGSFVPASRASIRKGLLPSARKMMALRPDVLIAAHGRGAAYDVDDRMLASFGEWVRNLERALENLIGLPDYEWGIDREWVSMEPYVSEAARGEPLPLTVTVTNHLPGREGARVSLVAGEGWNVSPDEARFEIAGRGRKSAGFTLVPGTGLSSGRHVVTASVQFAGREWGQAAECVIELS